MLHERLGFSPDVIEAQLAHTVRDSLGRAYNRTEFVEQRQRPAPLRQSAGARHRARPVPSSFYSDRLAEKQILALNLNNS